MDSSPTASFFHDIFSRQEYWSKHIYITYMDHISFLQLFLELRCCGKSKTREPRKVVHMQGYMYVKNSLLMWWRRKGGFTLRDAQEICVSKQYDISTKTKKIDQWNRIESPEINPCTFGHLIYNKEARIYGGVFSIISAGKTEQLHINWMKLECSLTPYTKINSKWIKYLNIRLNSIKLLEENISRILLDINHSKIFFNPPPGVMKIKTKVNKWGLIKLKSFCTAKETIKKTKR